MFFKDAAIPPPLETYCSEKENCLRSTLIRSVGGNVEQQSRLCCTVCNSGCVLSDRLEITQFRAVSTRKRRRVAVRRVDDSLKVLLKRRLLAERVAFVEENPCWQILGIQFVCSDALISQICDDCKYIASVDDIDSFFVRPELRDRFYDIVVEVVKDAPCIKRRHH